MIDIIIGIAHSVFTTPYGAILGALFGYIIGNRLSISRDRRKEFNKIAESLAVALTQERNFPGVDTTIDFFAFRRVLNRWELFWFDKYLKEYEQAKKNAQIDPPEQNELFTVIGSGRYHNPNPIVKSIDKLLKFTKRK